MTNTVSVSHVTYSLNIGFDAFISKFESQLGKHEISSYQNLLANPAKVKDAEKTIQHQEGVSGFMLFATYDHGALLNIKGAPRKACLYVVGNPVYAARMTEHDIRAALYAPLRVLVYVDAIGKTCVDYDLPSSLFGQFQNGKVIEVARELDRKLAALIENAL